MGLPGAVELVVQGTQRVVDHLTATDPEGDCAVLQVDLSNAFNSVSRSAVLAGVAHLFPHLLPWAILSLSVPSTLYSPMGHILSAEGVQPGSPLGPLFFQLRHP